jgi:hypothetical protein
MRPARWLAAALLLVPAAPAEAMRWTGRSPDRTVAASVRAHDGALRLLVSKSGRKVLAAELGPAPSRKRARAIVAQRGVVLDEFATPVGKRRWHRLAAARFSVRFSHRRAVDVIVADDGVAIRKTGGNDVRFRALRRTHAWLQRYTPEYERRYASKRLGAARRGNYGFPALLRTRAGDYALLTEAGLGYGEPAAHLGVHGRSLLVEVPQGEPRPATTPWRVAVIGDAAQVVASDLPLALGRPSEIADPSWIRPGRVAWSWWSDSASTESLERQRAFVDAAAANGWEYVLVDDKWATGAWMPELVAYARERGVGIHVWTPWTALGDPVARAQTLDTWASWGIAGIKVDFLHSDRAPRMRFMEDLARAAADRHLLVNFHGCTVPRGLQRTWPNVVTAEAVRGTEIVKAGVAMRPVDDVNLVFTRNVVGSMDYTPVVFSAPGQVVTAGHELAKAVAYESGLQHFADAPESYAARPDALALLSAVPVAWDDTRLLEGAPDHFATLARRAGEDWYVGSLSVEARSATLALDFLAPGRTYALRLLSDDGAGGLQRTDLVVHAGDRIPVAVARGGGYAAQLRAL